MNIVLIGIQGSGKGTLVSGLEQHYDFDLVSVGQLLRDEVATGSELGKHIHELQVQGLLVDMDIVLDALKKKLSCSTKELTIFDGFPRNVEQADAFDTISKVDLVINLNLPKEEAVKRLLNRLTCDKCGYITRKDAETSTICSKCGGNLVQRSDDTIEGINKRFEVYEKETYPILDKYKKQGVRVETIESINKEDTLKQVLKVINEYKN